MQKGKATTSPPAMVLQGRPPQLLQNPRGPPDSQQRPEDFNPRQNQPYQIAGPLPQNLMMQAMPGQMQGLHSQGQPRLPNQQFYQRSMRIPRPPPPSNQPVYSSPPGAPVVQMIGHPRAAQFLAPGQPGPFIPQNVDFQLPMGGPPHYRPPQAMQGQFPPVSGPSQPHGPFVYQQSPGYPIGQPSPPVYVVRAPANPLQGMQQFQPQFEPRTRERKIIQIKDPNSNKDVVQEILKRQPASSSMSTALGTPNITLDLSGERSSSSTPLLTSQQQAEANVRAQFAGKIAATLANNSEDRPKKQEYTTQKSTVNNRGDVDIVKAKETLEVQKEEALKGARKNDTVSNVVEKVQETQMKEGTVPVKSQPKEAVKASKVCEGSSGESLLGSKSLVSSVDATTVANGKISNVSCRVEIFTKEDLYKESQTATLANNSEEKQEYTTQKSTVNNRGDVDIVKAKETLEVQKEEALKGARKNVDFQLPMGGPPHYRPPQAMQGQFPPVSGPSQPHGPFVYQQSPGYPIGQPSPPVYVVRAPANPLQGMQQFQPQFEPRTRERKIIQIKDPNSNKDVVQEILKRQPASSSMSTALGTPNITLDFSGERSSSSTPLLTSQQQAEANVRAQFAAQIAATLANNSEDRPKKQEYTTQKSTVNNRGDVDIVKAKETLEVQKEEGLKSARKDDTVTLKSSSVPLEILARGSEAVYAFQKAMQTEKVKVYRGRIIILGQARAGKTSLKKSLLSLPFDPSEESTVGVEACEVEVDQVMNWTPSERKKLEESEFGDEIAKLIAKDLIQTEADKKNATMSQLDQIQKSSLEEEVEDQENLEPPSNEAESSAYMDQKSDVVEEVGKSKDEGPVKSYELELNIDTATLPNNVADLVVSYLQDLRLEDDVKTKEVILSLWDFAGQRLYYAAHSVFLSQRAVYVLVYNLNKNLLTETKPCCRMGINEILLENFSNESNLDNLLSWLVSVHSIRSVADDAHKSLENVKKKLPYLRPPVIIVGTHADQPFEDVKTTEKCIKKIISDQDYGGHVTAPFFAVNNKAENDEGVQKLRQRIMEVLKNEPYMGEEVPLRWFHFEKVVEALVAKSMYHMDLDQLLPVIKQFCRINDGDETTAMLNFYHDLGVIVKHGRTVVLKSQWLIDLFKQLITVPPFDEAVPKYRKYWKELQDTGILNPGLLDHVFSDFIEKGLRKQDILEMMELYGLIAKFSSGMSTSENEEEQTYFVPTQLTLSPSELCEIKPSERDPCPLFVHFLDGFVPHGLFPQFVSRCISWCSESGFKETPKLFNNGARFLLGKQIILALICRKRFIKVVLKRRQCPLEPSSNNASNKMAVEVRTFIERTLNGLSHDLPGLSNLRYELSVACTHCLQSGRMFSQRRPRRFGQDDSLHLLKVLPCGELASCVENFSDETLTVPGLEKWFELQHSQNEEQEMDKSSEAGDSDPCFSCKSGTPSDRDLLDVAHELGTSWRMLGRALDVPESVLEQIQEDNAELSERCCKVLIRWKQMSASDATYQRLAQALQHRSVGRRKLAVKYCGLHSCK
ncbi:uncharacterized protein [Montipora foliosa]|uniref:uncharacterized protein n=1 Tax=Montipora foliosa TaxID=591990 RepID=UPI0035F1A62E